MQSLRGSVLHMYSLAIDVYCLERFSSICRFACLLLHEATSECALVSECRMRTTCCARKQWKACL